jgi:dUTP pyrophosphatase
MINELELKTKILNKEAKLPFYATDEAAGFDFYSINDIILQSGKVTKIPIGLAFEIPKGFFLQIVSRSGLASKGIYNLTGTIDSDYRGEIHLMVFNTTSQEFKIERGDRIAQGLLLPIFRAEFKEVNNLSETKRGEGGFHSTGKK